MKKESWVLFGLVLSGCTPLEDVPDTDKPAPDFFEGSGPNIIVILADDLGFADVGYHGCNTEIHTPNIDRMAAEGMHFTNAYVTNSVSSPSRAGLMSGRYQQSFGYEDNPGPFRHHEGVVPGIPDNVPIMPQYLKTAGYTTALVGKWHLGGEESDASFPTRKGFDYFFGFLGGAASYYNGFNEKHKIFENEASAVLEDAYFTDILGQKAIDFIQENTNRKFFLYLSFNAVHGPLQVKDEILAKYAHIQDSQRRKLCAMQDSMDENIGKVMACLKEQGLDEETIVFFFSDNGGAPSDNHSMNYPYRGGKGTFFDGGIHSPFIVRWPGKIGAGTVCTKTVSSMDILPTALKLAGLKRPDLLDGADLMPVIMDEEAPEPHDCLYWKMNSKYAVRTREWKLVYDNPADGEMLFNIREDPYEKNNLAASCPDKLKMMKSLYAAWLNRLPPSLWGWQPGIGPYVQHPQENFENINRNWFEPLQNVHVDVIPNPRRKGSNTSANVFEIRSTAPSYAATGVRVNAGRFQQRLGYLHLKVLMPATGSVKAIFLGDGNYTREYMPSSPYATPGEWQELVFPIDFKRAVRNFKICFDGLKQKETTICVDDLYFSDSASVQ